MRSTRDKQVRKTGHVYAEIAAWISVTFPDILQLATLSTGNIEGAKEIKGEPSSHYDYVGLDLDTVAQHDPVPIKPNDCASLESDTGLLQGVKISAIRNRPLRENRKVWR